jgi:hypothetical protein
MKFLRRRSGLQTKNRIKSCEKVYSRQEFHLPLGEPLTLPSPRGRGSTEALV